LFAPYWRDNSIGDSIIEELNIKGVPITPTAGIGSPGSDDALDADVDIQSDDDALAVDVDDVAGEAASVDAIAVAPETVSTVVKGIDVTKVGCLLLPDPILRLVTCGAWDHDRLLCQLCLPADPINTSEDEGHS
jgi:hypothetical protein